jgi:hypothetical protein
MKNVLKWITTKKRAISPIQVALYLFVFFSLVLTVAIVTHPYWANDQFPYTHDGENHLARFANYKIALKEGQFPPRIGPNLHNRYGYPVFNFNYPLANILSVPFSMLKVSYEVTFSIQVISAVAFGWIGMWLATKVHLIKATVLPAVLASLYISAPYITTALFYRGNIGEIWAYALFPWLYLSCVWISKYQNFQRPIQKVLTNIATVSIWISFLLAHNLAVVISIPMLIAFAVITFKDSLAMYVRASMLGLLAVGSTLWFWLPALLEKQYITLSDVGLSKQFSTHFLHYDDIFIQAHRFGFSLNGFINSSTPSLGIPLLILFVIFISAVVYQTGLYVFQKRTTLLQKVFSHDHSYKISLTELSTSLLLLGVVALSLLMTTNASRLLWKASNQLSIIQFPWRWLLITPMVLILGIVSSIKIITKNSAVATTKVRQLLFLIVVPVVCIQLLAITRYAPADTFSKTNEDYDAFTMTTSTQNENFPKTFQYKDIADWQPTPTIINTQDEDKYTLSVASWNGSRRSYTIENSIPVLVAEPTMYFPGWKTQVISVNQTINIDLKESIEMYDSQLQGRIGFMLEPGSHSIVTKFTQDTWPRLIGNSISALSILGFSLYCCYEISKILRAKVDTSKS